MDPAALLSAIIASSDDAIVSKDLNGTITSWNGAAERMFGWSSDEAVGRSIRIIIPHDRQAEEDETLRRIRSGQRIDHLTTVRVRQDGSMIDVSLTISPVRDATGRVVGASKIARDVTERRRNEEALSAALATQVDLKRRLTALVAASSSILGSPRIDDVLPATIRLATELVQADGYAIWRLDPRTGVWSIGSYSGISPEFAALVVEAHQDAPPRSAEPFVAEDVASLAELATRRKAFETEGICSMLAIPMTIRGRASGSLAFYYRRRHEFSAVEVETSRALGSLAATAMTTAELYDDQEQSHRKTAFLAQIGSALASSLDYMTTLKHLAELAVPHVADWCAVALVTDGEIEQLAVAHADPRKMDLAREFRERYPDNPESQYSVAQVIRTGTPAIVPDVTDAMIVAGARSEEHLQAIRALGIRSFMTVPLLARRRTLGAITFVAAESGRHYGEPDLRFAEDVAARAALAIENARAYDEARRANQLKDDFLATLSHELRTPLNAILGYARMLRSGVLTGSKHTRGLEIVERSATSLTQIVEDVLDVSRIVSGKIRLNVQPVELPIIVNDAVATVLPAADARRITIQTVIDPDVGRVSGDADRLQQIVWNLLTNAVKFTPPDGRVDVSVGTSGAHAEIMVRDTGIGFAKEFAPHLFERFRQAHSGFDREHGGLGLGLAIVHQLVEMHGGTIEASSEGKDLGATFRVRLPLMAAASRGIAGQLQFGPADLAEPVPGESAVDLAGVHVLAVDDDADALALLREILESAGARVTTFASASAALDAVTGLHPDVLIADLGMPVMDGFELITHVRESSDAVARDVPAAALTAYARSEDRAKALRHGFQMHLAKPIDPAALIAAVAALSGPRSPAPATP